MFFNILDRLFITSETNTRLCACVKSKLGIKWLRLFSYFLWCKLAGASNTLFSFSYHCSTYTVVIPDNILFFNIKMCVHVLPIFTLGYYLEDLIRIVSEFNLRLRQKYELVSGGIARSG